MMGFTILRGRPPGQPSLPDTHQQLSGYTTDDGRVLLILPGRQAKAAGSLGASLGLSDPVVATCDHYCTITADPGQLLFGPCVAAGYQGWVELTADASQQRLLADFNIAETVSAIRHLPGFRSASFFLQQDRPIIYEHVVWESEPHFTAALQHPSFTRHLAYAADLAVAGWTALQPLEPL